MESWLILSCFRKTDPKEDYSASPVAGRSFLLAAVYPFGVVFFDLQKGFTIVGHSLSVTVFPGRTRKSLEVIFIFILSTRLVMVHLADPSFRISRSALSRS
jgi:hypothetical protein